MKANNLLYLKCEPNRFYRLWLEMLTPWHKLSSREADVAARIIEQYFKLKKSVPDPALLKEVMWSQSSRKDMRESLGMTPAHFQMVIAKLRKAGIIVDGEIYPKFIPHMTDEPRFCLQIVYDWSSPTNKIHGKGPDKQ